MTWKSIIYLSVVWNFSVTDVSRRLPLGPFFFFFFRILFYVPAHLERMILPYLALGDLVSKPW